MENPAGVRFPHVAARTLYNTPIQLDRASGQITRLTGLRARLGSAVFSGPSSHKALAQLHPQLPGQASLRLHGEVEADPQELAFRKLQLLVGSVQAFKDQRTMATIFQHFAAQASRADNDPGAQSALKWLAREYAINLGRHKKNDLQDIASASVAFLAAAAPAIDKSSPEAPAAGINAVLEGFSEGLAMMHLAGQGDAVRTALDQQSLAALITSSPGLGSALVKQIVEHALGVEAPHPVSDPAPPDNTLHEEVRRDDKHSAQTPDTPSTSPLPETHQPLAQASSTALPESDHPGVLPEPVSASDVLDSLGSITPDADPIKEFDTLLGLLRQESSDDRDEDLVFAQRFTAFASRGDIQPEQVVVLQQKLDTWKLSEGQPASALLKSLERMLARLAAPAVQGPPTTLEDLERQEAALLAEHALLEEAERLHAELDGINEEIAARERSILEAFAELRRLSNEPNWPNSKRHLALMDMSVSHPEIDRPLVREFEKLLEADSTLSEPARRMLEFSLSMIRKRLRASR